MHHGNNPSQVCGRGFVRAATLFRRVVQIGRGVFAVIKRGKSFFGPRRREPEVFVERRPRVVVEPLHHPFLFVPVVDVEQQRPQPLGHFVVHVIEPLNPHLLRMRIVSCVAGHPFRDSVKIVASECNFKTCIQL